MFRNLFSTLSLNLISRCLDLSVHPITSHICFLSGIGPDLLIDSQIQNQSRWLSQGPTITWVTRRSEAKAPRAPSLQAPKLEKDTHTPSLGKTNRASPPQGHLQSPYSSGHFSECPQIIIEDCWFCIFVPILLIWAPSPLRKHTKLKSYFPTLLVSAPSPLGTELPKAQLEAPHYAPPCLLYYAQTSLTYFRSSQFYTHLSHCPPSFNTALILEDPINRRLKTHKLVSSASLPVVESHHFVWLALNSQNRIPIGISKW